MGYFNDYVSKRMTYAQLDKELRELIKQYNKLKDTQLVVYVTAFNSGNPKGSMIQEDYFILNDLLFECKNENQIDMYIETPGGSGETAEEISKMLHDKFKQVEFVISGEAKSAGTILVLTGDEISMTETGSLGPIDAQVKIGRSVFSAYDYLEWMNEKYIEVEDGKPLNDVDATMIAQISPGEFRQVYNSLEFAKDIVKEAIPKYKFKNWNKTETSGKKVTPQMKKARAEELANDFVNHSLWRSHGRSLKINELTDLGLKINCIEADTKVGAIVYRIQAVCRLIFEASSVFKIFSTAESTLTKQTAQVATGPLPHKLNVAEFSVKCEHCGKKYDFYAMFEKNPVIDAAMAKKKVKKLPKNNKVTCECGREINLSGIRNDIEQQVHKKVID